MNTLYHKKEKTQPYNRNISNVLIEIFLCFVRNKKGEKSFLPFSHNIFYCRIENWT